MAISENSIVAHSDGVISAQLEDTIVLMSTDSGDYYDIDMVGSAIWEKIDQPKKIADLCAELCEEFDVDPKKCQADVIEFVTEMHGLGAIETT